MSKILLLLSGGKDSIGSYIRLVEEFGAENIVPLFEPYVTNIENKEYSAVNAYLTERFKNLNNICIKQDNADIIDLLDDVLKVHDLKDFYLCTGEVDNFGDVASLYEIVNRYDMLGIYNPFFGKDKALFFDTLKKYNIEFVVLSGISFSDDINNTKLIDCIGKTLTSQDIESMFSRDKELYFSLQTVFVQSSFPLFGDVSPKEAIDAINDTKSKEFSIFKMT